MASQSEADLVLRLYDPVGGDPVLNVLTSALHDANPRWSVKEISAVISSELDIELNALDLIPLLWQHANDDDVVVLLDMVATRSSSKECIIALQEVQEILFAELNSWDQDDHEDDASALALLDRLGTFISLYSKVIPRLTLRKKGPLDTLKPILKSIRDDIEVAASMANKQHGRSLLEHTAELVSSTSGWLKTLSPTFKEECKGSIDALALLLLSSTASFCSHIRSHLAEEYIENHFPRRYLRSAADPESIRGREIGAKLVVTAKQLRLSPVELMKMTSFGGQITLACIVLLSHWPISESKPELQQLANLEQYVETFLQKGVAPDELLYFVLTRANAPGTLQADGLVQYLVSLSSSSPDERQRNTAFVTLSVLLKRLPPPARLAHLAELLSPDDPLPQMRVAAVGLVKESILEALSSSEPNLFASKELFTQTGRFLLRPDPIDLFENKFNGDEFLSTAEPARLIECLGLYYTILRRDTANKTGIKDRSSIADTKRSLLEPLSKALEGELTRQAEGIDESSMSVIALSLALERVYDALGTLSS